MKTLLTMIIVAVLAVVGNVEAKPMGHPVMHPIAYPANPELEKPKFKRKSRAHEKHPRLRCKRCYKVRYMHGRKPVHFHKKSTKEDAGSSAQRRNWLKVNDLRLFYTLNYFS